jgi:hypothetical protein
VQEITGGEDVVEFRNHVNDAGLGAFADLAAGRLGAATLWGPPFLGGGVLPADDADHPVNAPGAQTVTKGETERGTPDEMDVLPEHVCWEAGSRVLGLAHAAGSWRQERGATLPSWMASRGQRAGGLMVFKLARGGVSSTERSYPEPADEPGAEADPSCIRQLQRTPS